MRSYFGGHLVLYHTSRGKIDRLPKKNYSYSTVKLK